MRRVSGEKEKIMDRCPEWAQNKNLQLLFILICFSADFYSGALFRRAAAIWKSPILSGLFPHLPSHTSV
jgi:hypothetical protein